MKGEKKVDLLKKSSDGASDTNNKANRVSKGACKFYAKFNHPYLHVRHIEWDVHVPSPLITFSKAHRPPVLAPKFRETAK